MYYEDRLSGAGFSRVLLAGARRRRATQAADVEQMRRSLEERLGAAVETVDPRDRRGADRSDHARRRRCSTRWRRSSACCCATGRRPRDPRPTSSTRPFYNERAVQLWLLAGRARRRRPRRVFNVVARRPLLAAATRELATAGVARRGARRRAARRRPRGCARASTRSRSSAASAEARQANDLIDRRTFSWTELFNRFETTLPDDVRITAVRPKLDAEARHRADDHRRRARRRGRQPVHREPRERPAPSRSC